MLVLFIDYFFFSSRRRHTRWPRDWSSDVCSSDLVEDVGVGGETARLVALGLLEPLGHVDGGVDGQAVVARGENGVVVGPTVGPDRVPDREGDPEEALARDQPVTGQPLHPVAVAGLHVGDRKSVV